MNNQNENQNQIVNKNKDNNCVSVEFLSYLNSNLNLHIVYLYNLPRELNHQELLDTCLQFGDVFDLIFPLEKSQRAFCIYFDSRSADKLIKSMNGKLYKNEKMKLKLGCSQPNYLIRRRGICSKVFVNSSSNKYSKLQFDDIKTVMSKYGEIKDSFEISSGQWVINYYDFRNAKNCVTNIKKITYKGENLLFNFFKTLRDLYDEIRKTQIQLCCERAMRYIESHSKEQFINAAIEKQIDLFVQEKNYYLNLLNFFNSDQNLHSKSCVNVSDLYPKSGPPLMIHVILDELIDSLLKNQGKKLHDKNICNLLSFSIIPSITNFFTIDFLQKNSSIDQENENIDFSFHDYTKTLKNLISKLKEKKGDNKYQQAVFNVIVILVTPMFASPYFTKFCSGVFQPIFSELQDILSVTDEKQHEKEINKSIEKLNENIRNNAHLVPSFVSIITNLLFQPQFFLKKCFLSLALKSPTTSIIYGFFHYSKPPEPSLLNMIYQKIDNESFYDCLMTCFNQSYGLRCLIKEKGELPNKYQTYLYKKEALNYFKEEMVQYQFKQIFQSTVLSQTDLDLINYIRTSDGNLPFRNQNLTKSSKQKLNKDEKEKYYRVYLTFPTENDSKFKEAVFGGKLKNDDNDDQPDINKTMVDVKDSITPSLRHLLQSSDPLPDIVDDSFLNNMDVIELLKMLLEIRGDIGSLPSRVRYSSYLQMKLMRKTLFSQIQYMSGLLPSTLLEQLDEIETLTITSSILTIISHISANTLSNSNNLFSILSNEMLIDSNSKFTRRSFAEYAKCSKFLYDDFKKNMKKVFYKEDSQELAENSSLLLKIIQKKDNFFNKDRLIYFEIMQWFYNNAPNELEFDQSYNRSIQENFDEIIHEFIEIQFINKDSHKNKNMNNDNDSNSNNNSTNNLNNTNNNSSSNNLNNNDNDSSSNLNLNNNNNTSSFNSTNNLNNNNDNDNNNNDDNDNNNRSTSNLNINDNNNNISFNINDSTSSIFNDDDDEFADINTGSYDTRDSKHKAKNEKFDENKFFRDKIESLKDHKDELFQIKRSDFYDTSIFRLVNNITKLFNDVMLYVREGWQHGKELGADDTAVFYPIIIMLYKPPNISFLCHFVHFFNDFGDSCFDQNLQHVSFNFQITKQVYQSSIQSLSNKKK